MSSGASTLHRMNSYDPWQALCEHHDVRLVVEELPGTRRGEIDFESRTITLHPRLRPAERRCTLTHELVHLERGPVLVRQTGREERVVAAISARRLVPLDALADVMSWTDDPRVIAEELDVDPRTIKVLLDDLTESERASISRVLEARA
jgi:hypothetical protein